MITIDDELTSRLQCMENEQNRLNKILSEVQELEGQINNIKTTLSTHDETTDKPHTIKGNCPKKNGYVVCLMFNPNSPVEWSGKQWQVHGKGKCYLSSEQASQCLVTLQQRWPGYPFKILKRELKRTNSNYAYN